MPAISLGLGEVEERLQQIRRRLNSRALQHVAYLSGTVIVLLGALLVVVGLRTPRVFHSYLTGFALVACAISGWAALRLRSRWLSLEAVARLADRQAGLDSRLATLCARRTHPQQSRLGGILLAQTLALGPRWDRSALAPRQVPRSIYLLLASLALLVASWFVPPAAVEPSIAQDEPSATAPDDESVALEEESLESDTLPIQASKETGFGSGGERRGVAQQGGPSGPAGQRSDLGNPDQVPGPRGLGMADAGGRPDQAAQQEQNRSGPSEGDKGSPAGRRAPKNEGNLKRDPADQQPSAQARAAAAAAKDDTASPNQRAKLAADSNQQNEHAKPRSEARVESAGTNAGSKPSGKTGGRTNDSLFEDGESPVARRAEDGKPGTFALRLTGTSESMPADFEPQNKKPREGVPALGMGQRSAPQTGLAEHQVEDDPLQKAQISPEHESLLRRIFQHD